MTERIELSYWPDGQGKPIIESFDIRNGSMGDSRVALNRWYSLKEHGHKVAVHRVTREEIDWELDGRQS